MNNQLKALNKKIRLINEVMQLNSLFDADPTPWANKRFATKVLHELLAKNCNMLLPFAEKEVMAVAKFCRDFFFNQEVVIKRKVHNDRLISIYIQEPLTEHICPLNPQAFLKMMDKIKIKP